MNRIFRTFLFFLAATPLFSATPVAWFKADAITGSASGSAISTWTDSSGNGYHAANGIASQRPLYVTNAMNGKPVVRFNSANNSYLAFTRPVQDDFTITCVFQSTQGLNSGTLYYQGAGLVNAEVASVVNDFGTCLFANGAICAGTGNPDVAITSAAGFNDGKPHIFTLERLRSTGLVSLFVDGTPAGSTTGGTQSLTSPSRIVLGAQQTLLYYFTGDISEVQVFNSALSTTDRQSVETTLFQKFNLPPSVPTGLYLQLQSGAPVLNWTASPGAADYLVKRSASPGGPFNVIGTNSTATFTDNTISPGNIYFYVVAAMNSTGISADSSVIGTDALLNPHDAIGPSARTTPMVFSEIMYKPAARADGKNLEFIELYNSNPWFQDLGNYQVVCADMSYKFPAGSMIPGNGYLVIAAAPGDVASVYGITNVMGPYTGSLKKSETIQLIDEQGAVLLTVPYSNIFPWPVAATGTGHSIVLANPTYGEGDPRAWDISDVLGGSPGAAETFHPSPLRSVCLNEILPHSENAAVPQFIELYNHSTASVDLSGCVLTDDPTTNKFVIPDGTGIGAAGFVSFTPAQSGITLDGAGGTLYFFNPGKSRVLDAVQYSAQADGVSFGRWPDGANDFYNFTTRTPGTNNSAILIGDIVINELMYDPISGNDNDQYIELFNQGTNTVNLNGWQFTAGVSFAFTNAVIGPNNYLVVARNLTNLLAKYPNLNSANAVGNFSGKLSHNGELVALAQPETLNGTPILVEADEVTYGTGGRWGQWSGGGGSSLELIHPNSNHRLAANWGDSDETQKSVWTNIESTGVLDNGANYESTIAHAQIGLLDAGECLVDNVEVDDIHGVNYVANPTFESGANNWSFQGCMTRSSLENIGFGGSSYSLHIRSSDRLWTGVNSCQANLNANTLAAGQTATLRFKARWLHGWPEILFRLNGNWLEATGPLPVPANLGSPGAANSRTVPNAPPAIFNVAHTPTLPVANQPIVVTAQVSDPNGVQNLMLNYRLDPATNYFTLPMNDGGTNGDAVPRDGIFSATIPGQAANQLTAFYISATNTIGAPSRFPSLRPGDNELPRECLVMSGDGNPGGSFGVYHLWISQTNVNRWANLPNLSNEENDCTFVNGNRVFYNIQGRFAGSPYHQIFNSPVGSLCHYKWEFNNDDKFLGATDFNKIHQPGNGPGDDASLQREQLANTLLRALGVPWLNRRYAAVYVNGNRRGILMEDTQTPDGDIVKEHFPDDADGWLYKMQIWFEMAPFPSGGSIGFNNNSYCNIMPYTTTGGAKKTPRYRYMFEPRRAPDSLNDFTNVFKLIDAASASASPAYVADLENIADMENWMRVFAANHAAGNWDSFGAAHGQNLYGYIGAQGTKYSLLMWDFNIVFGSGSSGAGADLFTLNSQDSNLTAIFNNPTFRRMYWRALQELVNGPLTPANSAPLLNAKYAAFTTNGLNVENPSSAIIPWLAQASSSIASQIAAVNTTNFSVTTTVVSNGIAYLSGQAPFSIANILVNNLNYPLTWTSVTSWTMAVPASVGTNAFNLVGLNRSGMAIAGSLLNSFVNYNSAGAVYSQNFDSLPNPGATSVNANNPVTINDTTYLLSNPFDFAFAVSSTSAGGLGLPAMAGWYGHSGATPQFGATSGDQTTGGDLDFGFTNSTNRALGLLATSSTGGTAFGLRLRNATGGNLSYLNLNFTGEVWRQSDKAKTLQFYYWIDPAATNLWPATFTAFVPALNVNFPAAATDSGGVAVNGGLSVNQTNLGVRNFAITNWPSGAMLWLVWQMTDNTGKAQGLAIDNLDFSAMTQPVISLSTIAIQISNANAALSWATAPGGIYRVQYKDHLTDANWTTLGEDQTGDGTPLQLNLETAASSQRFYRVLLVN